MIIEIICIFYKISKNLLVSPIEHKLNELQSKTMQNCLDLTKKNLSESYIKLTASYYSKVYVFYFSKNIYFGQFGMIWIFLTKFYHIELFRSMSDTLCFLSQFERKNLSNSTSFFLNLCKSTLNSLASLTMFSSRSLNPSY